jgi:hypothetical protein
LRKREFLLFLPDVDDRGDKPGEQAHQALFRRGPSRIQPPQSITRILHFIGRRTLEIYAIQLAGFELLAKLMPDLAP